MPIAVDAIHSAWCANEPCGTSFMHRGHSLGLLPKRSHIQGCRFQNHEKQTNRLFTWCFVKTILHSSFHWILDFRVLKTLKRLWEGSWRPLFFICYQCHSHTATGLVHIHGPASRKKWPCLHWQPVASGHQASVWATRSCVPLPRGRPSETHSPHSFTFRHADSQWIRRRAP